MKKLISYNNKKVTNLELEEIEIDDAVISVECLGYSGQYPSYKWYSINLKDGSSLDVFVR